MILSVLIFSVFKGEKMYMCGDKHVDAEDCEKSQSGYIAAFIFLIAHMMQGVGSSVYYTLGIAYLDDNARKTKVPMLLGKLNYFQVFYFDENILQPYLNVFV